MPFLIVMILLTLVNLTVAILVHRQGSRKPLERNLPGDAEGFLSTEFLVKVANSKRLNSIRNTSRGRERLNVVEDESEENGVVGTLTICVDQRGVIALKDGHHRLLYALDNEIDYLPVKIRQSKGIRSHGCPISEVLPELLLERRVSEPEELSG